MSWDPARGMHYKTVETESVVQEGTDVTGMVLQVSADEDELDADVNHRRWVGIFLFGVVGAAGGGGESARVARDVVHAAQRWGRVTRALLINYATFVRFDRALIHSLI